MMAKLETAQVPSASETVYQNLVRAIVECRLAPDESLSDRELALQLGVSRTPVREAFHQLEAAGLVRRRGRIGWAVAGFDRRDVQELIELRTVLEAAGIARVVTWDDDRLARLAGLFDAFTLPMSKAAIARYLKSDHELHLAFINATDNRRFIDIYRYVEWHIERVRHFVSYRVDRRVDQSLGEHLRICRALQARDAPAATQALTEHLANLKRSFQDLLEQTFAAASAKEDE